jgi:hypothetical protein
MAWLLPCRVPILRLPVLHRCLCCPGVILCQQATRVRRIPMGQPGCRDRWTGPRRAGHGLKSQVREQLVLPTSSRSAGETPRFDA